MNDKSRVLGYFVYYLSLISIVVTLVYHLYFSEWNYILLIDVFKQISLINTKLGASLCVMLIFSLLGIILICGMAHNIAEYIFRPSTKEELRLKKECRKIKLKYSEGIARLKIQELEKLSELKDIKDRLKVEERMK
jgi:hypothetical protein